MIKGEGGSVPREITDTQGFWFANTAPDSAVSMALTTTMHGNHCSIVPPRTHFDIDSFARSRTRSVAM